MINSNWPKFEWNGIYIQKSMTLKKIIRIKDIYKNHPSDHYMLTPGAINQLNININGSIIEVYTPEKLQEI